MRNRYDHYFYKALLSLYEEETFNRLFANLFTLYMGLRPRSKAHNKNGGDLVPGDLVYFKTHK